MSDRLFAAFREQIDLANRKRLAQLQQPAFADDCCAGRGLAKKVDVQVRGDRQRDDSNLAEDGNVQSHIGYRHKYRTGDRATRPQLGDPNFMANGSQAVADRFDRALGLRELVVEEVCDFGG